MTPPIVATKTAASTPFVQVADDQGRLLAIPEAVLDHLMAAGQTVATFTVLLDQIRFRRPWLTKLEATRIIESDIDAIAMEPGGSFDRARMRLNRAIATRKIVTTPTSDGVLIEQDSLDAWRLAMRDRDLDAAE